MSYWVRASEALDRFCYAFSVYAVPLAVALVSLVAWVTWHNQYAYNAGQPLPFRVLEQTRPDTTPSEALAELRQQAGPVLQQETKLSERPFWFLIGLAERPDSDARIEFPSRHTKEITCWNGQTLQPLGSGDRTSTQGAIARIKSGFELDVRNGNMGPEVLCRATHSGPARISILEWSSEQLAISVSDEHRRSGLLEGSLLMLAAFVLLVALVGHEWLYVLFAAWLVTNFRLAGLSTGWDAMWLGYEIPVGWLPFIRKFSISAYYILTYTLFIRLFTEDIKRVGFGGLLNLAQWLGLPLLVAAFVLPYSMYLPVMWLVSSIGALTLVFFIGRILILSRSEVANWYGASIAVVLISTISEIISAAMGVKNLISASNSVTAAAISSLMAALAIAAQMREERRQRVRAETELRGTYEALPIGLFTVSFVGDFLQQNPAQRVMLGSTAAISSERHRWQDYFDDESWPELRRVADRGGDMEVHGRTGTPLASRTFHLKVTVSGDRIEGSMQDVTDRAKATERLEYLAENDPLTSVLNRRGIEKALAAATAGDAGQPATAIAYLDLDRFKLINDLYGHTTGDQVLREVCARIKDKLGEDHKIGRVGGDEFVVIFRDVDIGKAASICRRMIAAIEDEPCHIGDKAFQVKGSIGLIELIDGTVIRDAISIADRACREAKRNPASLVVYERGARAFRERSDELALIGRFDVGNIPEGLFLDMQPIMSLTAPYDSLDFEVLLRLREPDNSITPAGKIISAAENNGRISLIDRWVLSTVLTWLQENRARLTKTRFVCVNLSGGSLNDERFIRDAFSMIAEAGDLASLVCFEITESVALHDLGNTNRFIDMVRRYGAKVALDDFGAGYTSFSYLKELAAEAVKIDGAFVRDVNSHPANLAIVEAIAELSRNLGMKTIAEWAEDAETVAVLKEVGVDYVQGYAVARPMSPDRILTADSCAALIEDPQVARLVWEGIGRLEPARGEIPAGLVLPPLPTRRRH